MQKVGEDMNRFDEIRDKLPYTPIKKQESEVMRFTRYSIQKDIHEDIVVDDASISENLLRKATLSASVSPYLRSVLMLAENRTHYFLFVLEASEEKIKVLELVGALVHFEDNALAVKEEGVSYFIKPKGLTSLLTKEIERLRLKNISLANIHHDYVRYFCGAEPLEEVIIFHLLHNDFERLEEVIRKV